MIHYIIIRHPFSSDHMPTTEHEHLEDAIKEAQRLTQKHPNSRFRVYQFRAESWASVEVKCDIFHPPNARDHRAGEDKP